MRVQWWVVWALCCVALVFSACSPSESPGGLEAAAPHESIALKQSTAEASKPERDATEAVNLMDFSAVAKAFWSASGARDADRARRFLVSEKACGDGPEVEREACVVEARRLAAALAGLMAKVPVGFKSKKALIRSEHYDASGLRSRYQVTVFPVDGGSPVRTEILRLGVKHYVTGRVEQPSAGPKP